jgi:Alginate export
LAALFIAREVAVARRDGEHSVEYPRGTSRRAGLVVSVCVALLGAASSALADPDGTLMDALEATQPLVNIRMRSESVGQFATQDSAEAVTVRGRFGFETGEAWGTSVLAEGVALTPLDTDYNSTVNGKTRYPTVPDPETYGLDRLELVNTSIPETTLTVGRQRVNLDDQRFVGSVNWRQLEQTFDAVRVVNRSLPGVTIDLTYLDRVKRVFGPDSSQGTYRGDNYLANVAYQTPFGRLVGFAYLLDFDIDPTDSTQTYGSRFSGTRPLGAVELGYSISYAVQRPRANNPLRFKDDYYEGELSAGMSGVKLTAGAEILGGDGIKGFTTPLATLHAFQGWGEQFLTHPPDGIDDRFASIAYTRRKVLDFLDTLSGTVAYHDFHSQRLYIDYGTETDGQIKATRGDFSVIVEYADFRAEQYSRDTHKLWMELDYVL